MTQNANTFLQVRDLVVEYTSDGKVIHAVNGVNFDLERGKALALVGETGAGKTTIAKSIMRILPDPPAHVRSGQVVLQGRDLMKLNEADMRKVRGKEISMIFQDPMTALNPTMRIGDQIAEVIRLHDKVTKAESMQKAQKMLETVGITAERYGNYPHQFSGGMKQRVVIAMALIAEPELLLADEPTTALDVTIQAQILDMMRRLQEELGTTVLLISHDLGVVAGFCDRVAVMYAGRIVELGRVEQYVDMALTYLRLEEGGSDYVIRTCAVDDVVRAAVRRFAGEFIDRRIALDYTPVEWETVTDGKWLTFVVEQLLSNALKYTGQDGTVRIYREGDDLCIRDSGMGIAPEDLPRVFDMGYTGQNGRLDRRSSGIGLYLCRRICRNLRHEIRIESVPGVGTTVRLTLGRPAFVAE